MPVELRPTPIKKLKRLSDKEKQEFLDLCLEVLNNKKIKKENGEN